MHPTSEAHDMLVEQVQNQLEERVVQELEIACRQYISLPVSLRALSTGLVRALTDEEAQDMLSKSRLPDDTAQVAMVVFDDEKVEDSPPDSSPPPSPGPFATLLPVHPPLTTPTLTASSSSVNYQKDELLPPQRVPIYRASRIFGDLAHRESARHWLDRFATKSISPAPKSGEDVGRKPSTAYLLSNPLAMIENKVDVSGVAIALWRLRLWDGDGWTAASKSFGLNHSN